MACVAVLSLMRTLELEFFNAHPRPILQQKELISCNKMLAQSLHKKLGSLIQLLDETRMNDVEAIKDLETKLRDVSFQIEDEIELQVVHLYEEEEEIEGEEDDICVVMPRGNTGDKSTHHCLRLHQILHPPTGKSHPCLKFRRTLHRAKEDIDVIEEELVKVKMEYNDSIALQGRKATLDSTPNFDKLVSMDSSSKHASHSEDIMVGKNNEFHTIKEMLTKDQSGQLKIVSIQGMGGIGKTTLARQVYEDSSITSHFDKQVWVVVSQHHNKRQMLLHLLDKDNANIDNNGELAEKLYQSLKGNRFLIVMDDIWSTEAWDAVKSCFPDDQNASWVLLTTRLAEVATYIGSNNGFFYQMHLLNESESWNLFCKKACKSREVEFETIGKPIVEKCKGLPLAIVVVAGLFSKLETLDEWKNAAKALNSSTRTTIDEECSKILSLSYNQLPHNLKACFLYLGVFPEDKKINANKLARLWAAEGFVKTSENESFEAMAERYIIELMDRNLILVSERSSCGRKIKAFRVHDLLHAFCVREAGNQSLLHVIYKSGSDFPQKGFRWVRIQLEGFDISALSSCSKNCRSIFYFGLVPKSLNLKIFNLWRVLFVTRNFLETLVKTVDLVHLRYLAASNLIIPFNGLSFKAWNLQTFRVFANYLRRNIFEFPQLQYIRCSIFYGDSPKSIHQTLETISALDSNDCTQEYLTKIRYLKKVSVRAFRGESSTKNLVYLPQLESLSVDGDDDDDDEMMMMSRIPNMAPMINNILLLKNLRKLKLFWLELEWEAINVLSKLPRLEVLNLIHSTLGEKWELPENEKFSHLICLKIWYTNLKHWNFSAYHFPKLERLILGECYQLTQIPDSFAEIPTLNLIQLKRCLPSAVMSAKEIRAEQHDYGNENMVVIEIQTREPGSDDEGDSDENEE